MGHARTARLALLEHLRHAAVRLADVPGERLPAVADQEAALIAVGNCIGSLRNLGSWEWTKFVERESRLERILRGDPAGIYPRMDSGSRDAYRQVVERLARRSPLTVEEVARRAVQHAQQASEGTENLAGHVGYYLVDAGRTTLEESIGYRRPWKEALCRLAARAPLAWYLGGVAVVEVVALTAVAALLWRLGAIGGGLASGLLLALLAAIATQFSLQMVNRFCTWIVPPRPLVRMDFSHGIPPQCRTLVAIPAMLGSRRGIAELARGLQLQLPRQTATNLRFALVTDFLDAPRRQCHRTAGCSARQSGQSRRLNDLVAEREHGTLPVPPTRRWNPQEGVWMGRKRKRGKLAELEPALRSGRRGDFRVTPTRPVSNWRRSAT